MTDSAAPTEGVTTPPERPHHPHCPALYFTNQPERCRCIFLAMLDKPERGDD